MGDANPDAIPGATPGATPGADPGSIPGADAGADTGWAVRLRHGPVELRPLRLGDVRPWSRLRQRDREQVRRGEFRSPVPYRLANSTPALAVVALRLRRRARRGRALPWSVYYDGRFAGRFALFHLAGDEAEVGGWIASALTGRGIFTTAKALAIDHGFGRLGLRRIYGHIRSDNPASLHVAEKIGLRVERTFVRREGDGVCREWRLLAIYAADHPAGVLSRLTRGEAPGPPAQA